MKRERSRSVGFLLAAGLAWVAQVERGDAQFMTGKRIFDEQQREAKATLKAEELVSKVGFDQRLGGELPLASSWRDVNGETRQLGEFFGKRPVLLAFGYYHCPVLCPLLVDGIVAALKPLTLQLGVDFEVVFVSIDPKDTPETALRYQKRALSRLGRGGEKSEGWHFLVGDPAAIASLTEAAGFRYVLDPATGEYAHAAGLVVASPEGRISRYLFGVDFAPRDIRFALLDASAGRVGTVADRMLLLCFEYNEALGRYTALTFFWLRVGGVLTFLALITAIVSMLWRERRARQLEGASLA
jgi:protein SCO1/2